MVYDVVWTEPAVADLEAAVRYLARRDPATAESLRVELLESVEVLGRFPLIGAVYERIRAGGQGRSFAGHTESFTAFQNRTTGSKFLQSGTHRGTSQSYPNEADYSSL